MSSQTKVAGVCGNDATVGTVDWVATVGTLLQDTSVEDGTVGQTADLGGDDAVIENSIRLTKGGSFAGDDKSTGATINTGALTFISYGGVADLWNTTWTPAQINATGFGVYFSVKTSGATTKYLGNNTFGFTIPTDVTVDGISVRWKVKNTAGVAQCDYLEITVTYSQTVSVSDSIAMGTESFVGNLSSKSSDTISFSESTKLNLQTIVSDTISFVETATLTLYLSIIKPIINTIFSLKPKISGVDSYKPKVKTINSLKPKINK